MGTFDLNPGPGIAFVNVSGGFEGVWGCFETVCKPSLSQTMCSKNTRASLFVGMMLDELRVNPRIEILP